ncbi:MAG TPA: FG-GAP-like repeat-containing protein [Azospirillaceae bacterium]|nr:FG-GAP-like repeat-containing protein [Azospirillaceae bacterium]
MSTTGLLTPDDFSANPSTTGLLGAGGSVLGAVDFNGDNDWFRVDLTVGVTYTISLAGAGPAALADPAVAIYSGTGRILRFNDDASAATRNSSLTYTPAQSGTFFVAATSALADQGGGYNVSLDAMPAAPGVTANALIGDFLFQNTTTGAVAAQLSAGGSLASRYLTIDGNRTVQAAADINGDGLADLVYGGDDGITARLAQRSGEAAAKTILTITPDWKAAATTDFDGDGRADLILQHDSGVFGTLRIGVDGNVWTPLESIGSEWRVVGALDANGDGTPDIMLQNQQTGWVVTRPVGTDDTGLRPMFQVETAVRLAGTGDVTGDGRAEILYQRTDTGEYGYLRPDGLGGVQSIAVGDAGLEWRLVGVGDLDLPVYG